MSAVVAIGDPRKLAGYALAGVAVLAAVSPEEAHAAWAGPASGAGLVLLTASAAEAIDGADEDVHRLVVVVPE